MAILPRGALDQAALQQVGLVDILYGIACLAEATEIVPMPTGPAQLVYDETQVIPVGPVEAEVVDALPLERRVCRLLVYLPVADDLGIVAHPLEEPVDEVGRPAATSRELPWRLLGDWDAEYLRVADHDLRSGP